MHYVIYKDIGYLWRWTLFSSSGSKLAFSGEGYATRAACEYALKQMRGSRKASVVDGSSGSMMCMA